MATGSHSTAHAEDAASIAAEKKAAEMILRPVARPEAGDSFSGPPSRLSGRGSTRDAAADFAFADRRYGDAAIPEHGIAGDGLGAMRGLAFVLGLYVAMAAVGACGLLVWHWLR